MQKEHQLAKKKHQLTMKKQRAITGVKALRGEKFKKAEWRTTPLSLCLTRCAPRPQTINTPHTTKHTHYQGAELIVVGTVLAEYAYHLVHHSGAARTERALFGCPLRLAVGQNVG